MEAILNPFAAKPKLYEVIPIAIYILGAFVYQNPVISWYT